MAFMRKDDKIGSQVAELGLRHAERVINCDITSNCYCIEVRLSLLSLIFLMSEVHTSSNDEMLNEEMLNELLAKASGVIRMCDILYDGLGFLAEVSKISSRIKGIVSFLQSIE
eukprot:863383_1